MLDTVREISISYDKKTYGKVTNSRDSYQFLKNIWNQANINVCEEFKVLFLDQANNIVGFKTIGIGGINQTTVDSRIILAIALKTLATGIILSHNHPSGNLTPSNADKEITKKIVEAAKIHEIQVLDHIIMVPRTGGYFSFADEGVI